MSQENEQLALLRESKERFEKTALQLLSYTHFIRWAANFKRNEVLRHPNHAHVFLLSPMQSARFAFALEGQTLLIGVQPYEEVWFSTMPFSSAYLSDRLYLRVENVSAVETRMSGLAIGLFVDGANKLAMMRQATMVQGIAITAQSGKVASVGRVFGERRFPLVIKDVVERISTEKKEKIRDQDAGRFL